MGKDLAVKEENQLAENNMAMDWCDGPAVRSETILIPKLLLMQGLSDAVTQELAQMGDMINSVTKEVIGSAREKSYKPVAVIPIHLSESWQVIDRDTQDFIREEPLTAKNASLPWEFEEDGRNCKRVQTINVFVLKEDEIGDPMALPYLLSFRNTSHRAGKAFCTHFAKCQNATQMYRATGKGKPVAPAEYVFEIGGTKRSDDKNTWYVFTVSQKGKASPEALDEAYRWFQVLRKNEHKVDDSDTRSTEDVVEEGPEF